jgi:hypothetical protein
LLKGLSALQGKIGMTRMAAALGVAWMAGCFLQPATAREVFEGTFTINGQTVQASGSDAEGFANLFTDSGLRGLVSTYTTTSAATASVSLRGVPATLSYNANSTTLRLQVPGANIDRSFTGATRDESQDEALRWLRGQGDSDVSRLLRFAVSSTPIDPVAGNPNSLMSTMGAADFGAATGASGARVGSSGQGGSFGAGARFGSYSAGGYDTSVYTLPLSYSYGFEGGTALLIDAPITLMDTSDAQSYSGSIGVGLRMPVPIGLGESVQWSLTPMLRTGAVGSVELGTVGAIWSASLTSVLNLRLNEATTLTIGNMVGRLQTIPVTIQDYDISYELVNNIFRNGVVLTRSAGVMLGREVTVSGFVVDTRFTGDSLFVNSYQEYGAFLNFGNPVQVGGMNVPMRIGATYIDGEQGYRGFTVNFGISF